MLHRLVGDLMTSAVVSVRRDTGFKDTAQHLAQHDITAVPVIDDQGRPVGVVSEADMLRKQQSQVDPGGHPPLTAWRLHRCLRGDDGTGAVVRGA